MVYLAVFNNDDGDLKGIKLCHSLEEGITVCQSQCDIWDHLYPDASIPNPARSVWNDANPMPNVPYGSPEWLEWKKDCPPYFIPNPNPQPYVQYSVSNNSKLYETDENGMADLSNNLFEFEDFSIRVPV